MNRAPAPASLSLEVKPQAHATGTFRQPGPPSSRLSVPDNGRFTGFTPCPDIESPFRSRFHWSLWKGTPYSGESDARKEPLDASGHGGWGLFDRTPSLRPCPERASASQTIPGYALQCSPGPFVNKPGLFPRSAPAVHSVARREASCKAAQPHSHRGGELFPVAGGQAPR
jgi:hypothetical protein